MWKAGWIDRYELIHTAGDLQQFQPKADWSRMKDWGLCLIGLLIWTKINQP